MFEERRKELLENIDKIDKEARYLVEIIPKLKEIVKEATEDSEHEADEKMDALLDKLQIIRF